MGQQVRGVALGIGQKLRGQVPDIEAIAARREDVQATRATNPGAEIDWDQVAILVEAKRNTV